MSFGPNFTYFALVAERDGEWMGAFTYQASRDDLSRWALEMLEAGATVKVVKDRAEYDAWNSSVT